MSLSGNKNFYVSWEAFHRATKELAKMCLHGNFDSIVAVSRGGLVPATIIARELNIRVLDTICVSMGLTVRKKPFRSSNERISH